MMRIRDYMNERAKPPAPTEEAHTDDETVVQAEEALLLATYNNIILEELMR